MSRVDHKSLKILEASTGIEPVYTDLQSAASPLRQLAAGAGGPASGGEAIRRGARGVKFLWANCASRGRHIAQPCQIAQNPV